MIATAYFYSLPCSLRAGTVFQAPPSQDDDLESLKDYLLGDAVSNVKITDDMHQTLVMKMTFDDWSKANTVLFITPTNEHLFYWVTDAVVSSIDAYAVVYSLDFNAPMTYCRNGRYISGQWVRTPKDEATWLGIDAVSSQMIPNHFITGYQSDVLKNLATYSGIDGAIGIWVQVTATINGYQQEGNITLWGFPAIITKELLYSRNIPDITIGSTAWIGSYDDTMGHAERKLFPPLMDFIGNITSVKPLTADRILDVSVSTICPYKAECGKVDADAENGASNLYFDLIATDGTKLPVLSITVDNAQSTYGAYDLTNVWHAGKKMPSLETVEQACTMELGAFDEIFRKCGQLDITDWNYNTVYSIPTAYIGHGSHSTSPSNVTNIIVRLIPDAGKMIRQISIIDPWTFSVAGDSTTGLNAGRTIPVAQFDEPHIPWAGSQWQTYEANSRAYDRQDMKMSALFNLFGSGSSVMGSAGNIASMNLSQATSASIAERNPNATAYGLASMDAQQSLQRTQFGLGMVSQGANMIAGPALSYSQSLYNQEMREKRMQHTPGQVYSASNGFTQVLNMVNNAGHGFVTRYPMGLTQSVFDNYVYWHGYPCDHYVNNIGFYKGYYQGEIERFNYADTNGTMNVRGLRLNALIEAFRAGFRIYATNTYSPDNPSGGVVIS